jgi:hypothetical protein
MVRLYGLELSRDEVLARMGGLDQVAGVRRIRLEDGPEDGVSAVEVRTGGGLSYTVAPSRAMDVVAAECDGLPLAWRSGAGEMHPAYGYRTSGWNLTWFGGLLATCGLDNVGSPGEDELGAYPQHGWLNGVAARQVGYGGRWQAGSGPVGRERYVMWVEGELRQKDGWVPGGYDVVLRRRIESELGGRTIRIADEVENMAGTPAPLLLLYHVNAGFPLVDPEAEIVSRSRAVRAHGREEHDPAALRVGDPTAEFRSEGHAHDLLPDADGNGEVALLNPRLQVGLGLRFPLAELPFLAQWKALVARRYVVSLEPTNQPGGNRARHREQGTLPTLAPGEVRRFHLEIEVLRGAEELAAARERMRV